MKKTSAYRHGFADTWGFLKLSVDVPPSDWLPPNARPPATPGAAGRAAGSAGMLVNVPEQPRVTPGVFRRIWSKVKGLPLAAKIGLGAGAGLLGGAALLSKDDEEHPSRFDNYNAQPELQAMGYGQQYSRYR